jgi:hypothetical protein
MAHGEHRLGRTPDVRRKSSQEQGQRGSVRQNLEKPKAALVTTAVASPDRRPLARNRYREIEVAMNGNAVRYIGRSMHSGTAPETSEF